MNFWRKERDQGPEPGFTDQYALYTLSVTFMGFPGGSVKNLPATQET